MSLFSSPALACRESLPDYRLRTYRPVGFRLAGTVSPAREVGPVARNGSSSKKKSELTADLRRRIVAAGRRRERPAAAELAEELGTDVFVVRRVWQAGGLTDVPAATRARAERLVATWMERGRA